MTLRVVVVLQVERVPGLARELFLPVRKGALELLETEGPLQKVGHDAVGFHVREVEHEVQLAGLKIGERGLRSHARPSPRSMQS